MKVKEQVMRWVFAATAAFSIAAVALICVFLFLNGLPFFTKYDLGAFLSGTTWKPANNIFGILPMIVGSLYVTGGALLFGAPVGILAGIYLARFCPVRLRKIIEPMIGLMAGVPSIVYGFFGLTTLVPLIREMFGGRDHTTIIHARDKISDEIKTNPRIKITVADIRNMILNR